MLDVLWHFAAVGTDAKASGLLFLLSQDPRSLQKSDLNWARVARSFLVKSFSASLIE